MLILEIITGVLLPWVLLAPTIPLLLLLIRRDHSGKAIIAIAMLCVVSILSNIFVLVAQGSALQTSFMCIGFVTEIIFTGLALKYCTDNQLLQYCIIASILIFGSVYITFMVLAPSGSNSMINMFGTYLIFLMSILVLLSKTSKLDQNLALTPAFWFAGGTFIHYGLLSLLLSAGKKITDLNYREPDDFSILYVSVFVLQFLLFATGILIRRPWRGFK